MRKSIGSGIAAICLITMVPPGLAAQAVPSVRQSAANAAATAQFAPTELRWEAAPAPLEAALVRSTKREGTILMIVGLAGIITGVATDESIITVAGAGAAGIGLYLYLRNSDDIIEP